MTIAMLVATVAVGVFAGASVYVTVVQHPAWVKCGPALSVRHFSASTQRAAILQGGLAVVGLVSSVVAWLLGSGVGWLLGGLLLGAMIPFTLVVIMPTNRRLEDPQLDAGSHEAAALLLRWGRLHAVRTAVGITVFVMLVLLSGTFACAARPPKQPDAAGTGPSVRWPIPTGWKHETFALPPEFAPEFPYHGTEDLRFMPGFNAPTAPDYWSYDFVWWMDQPPPFDATSLAATLVTYFRGLATAVGGSKFHLDPARYHAVLTSVSASGPPRLTGQVFTYDPFVTGLPITLNVEAELRSCPGTRQVAIVVALSPKDTTDSVWKALRVTAGTLVCI